MTALRRIGVWRRFLAENTDKYSLIENAEDVLRAQKEDRLAVGFHFQGSTPFGRDLDLVETFYRLGVRCALLAYNQRNFAGDGCHDVTDAGLSRFGRDLIREMQRVGMLVDCSHTGHRTSMEAFEMATSPMVYTHENPAAVHSHERNISNGLAKACVATGGVVGVSGVGIFLGETTNLAASLFRYVDHWVQLLGSRHVRIGLDSISDVESTLKAMRSDPTKWPAEQGYQADSVPACGPESLSELTEQMLVAGYSDDECRSVLGQNWLRLAGEVWKAPF